MFILTLALRNLFRNTRRTVITSGAVVFGVAFQVLGWGLVDGLDDNFLRAVATTTTGDILIRPPDFPTDGLSYPVEEASIPPAFADFSGESAPRALFTARVVHHGDAARGMGVAYEPDADYTVFPRERWRVTGVWPDSGKAEVALGDAMARMMGVGVGDQVTVQARTVEGAQNAMSYAITALIHTDNGQMDNSAIWLRMEIAEELLQLKGRRTHVSLRIGGLQDAGTVRDELVAAGALTAPDGQVWSATTTREEAADMLAINDIRRRAILLLVGVIMAIAATGIANTVIMAAYERVREIGTLLALGMKRRDVSALFLVEGALLGFGAGLAGAVLGSFAVLYWQSNGIVLSEDLMKSQSALPVSAVIYTHFNWAPVLGSLTFSAVIATLASVQPARFAARLNPADAVRAD
ncbi:MAG: ABC transporter permease [Myxococcales bacterium]|nr:ABC transporter permease [Myxococcales bacterium]